MNILGTAKFLDQVASFSQEDGDEWPKDGVTGAIETINMIRIGLGMSLEDILKDMTLKNFAELFGSGYLFCNTDPDSVTGVRLKDVDHSVQWNRKKPTDYPPYEVLPQYLKSWDVVKGTHNSF